MSRIFVVSYLAAGEWAEGIHLVSPSTFPLQKHLPKKLHLT